MAKINLLENLNLNEKPIREAEKFAFEKLGIDWDIDVVCRKWNWNNPDILDHVSGHTYESDLIRLSIEDGFADYEIAEVLVHELCHAARWGKNPEYINTLFDCLIFEGLAVCFEWEFAKDKPKRQAYLNIIVGRSDKDNEKILESVEDKLNNSDYSYDEFFGWNKNMPWAGYSLGYYLVKKYLKKTGKTIEEVFANRYGEIETNLFLDN